MGLWCTSKYELGYFVWLMVDVVCDCAVGVIFKSTAREPDSPLTVCAQSVNDARELVGDNK